LRLALNTLLRVVVGAYFVFTSLYCLLAYLPYTFYFLIKAPAYAWMPWFVHHQAALFWVTAASIVFANWRVREAWSRRDRRFLIGVGLLTAAGIYLSLRPFLPSVQDDRAAYWWALISLLPLAALSLWKRSAESGDPSPQSDNRAPGYSAALLIAVVICGIYTAGARMRVYSSSHALSIHWADAELTLWSLLSHVVLAVFLISIINLVFVAAAKTRKPRAVRRVGVAGLVFIALSFALSRFLDSALSFGGWSARAYAGVFGLAFTLWGFSVIAPFLDTQPTWQSHSRASRRILPWIVLGFSTLLAITFPYLIGGADWSGFFAGTVTLVIWVVVSLSLLRLRPSPVQYSALAVLLVLTGSAAAYKTIEASEIFWSRPLGATDDDISMALDAYAGNDSSFQLAHSILDSGRNEACGDLCRITREYTNVRDTQAHTDVQLVDTLNPASGPRPNIFIFVIDSMRPDYLGPYNPRATYTPNLDAFARDSIVFHHAYSQYAGTSLSEPAIWSGAMLLHAHYVQPFSRLNSLDRMLHVDNYRILVSYDDVLREILPGNDGLVKLDTDKKLWNQFEIGSTLEQARAVLDRPRDPAQPVFLFAQPKNVHQFARNDVPSPTSQHWVSPPGLNNRITYEVHWVDSRLGEFFTYLKQHDMYDNSIIIVTSDHGDATGEFGRLSHSTLIWPEVMQVPLIVHLPAGWRNRLVYDDSRLATLTDITPTLYYLLGHRPIRQNPLFGRPLFAGTRQELDHYADKDLLLASDVHAVYGILTADGRYLYTTYDSPARSYLFDLKSDPNALHDILTPELEQRYDEEIIEHLHLIGDFYGYHPGVGSLLVSAKR